MNPEDVFLISVESLIAIGLLIAVIFAYRVHRKHPKLTSKGWMFIIVGIVFLFLHAVFDVLDTLQLDSLLVDSINVLDGATFVVGLLLFAFGIYRIAIFGAEQWRL